MIPIRSSADLARALAGASDPHFRRLLAQRHDQLVGGGAADLATSANFIVVEPGDRLAAVEAAAGFPLTGDAAPLEWTECHAGGWLEAAIITDDDGFAVVILARDCPETDPDLLAALLAHA